MRLIDCFPLAWISQNLKAGARCRGAVRLRPDHQGDRVLGVMAGLLGMNYAAFEHKKDFYVLDES